LILNCPRNHLRQKLIGSRKASSTKFAIKVLLARVGLFQQLALWNPIMPSRLDLCPSFPSSNFVIALKPGVVMMVVMKEMPLRGSGHTRHAQEIRTVLKAGMAHAWRMIAKLVCPKAE